MHMHHLSLTHLFLVGEEFINLGGGQRLVFGLGVVETLPEDGHLRGAVLVLLQTVLEDLLANLRELLFKRVAGVKKYNRTEFSHSRTESLDK